MNREQLDALRRLGLITAEQYTASLASRSALGVITDRPTFTLELAARNVTLSAESRVISGTVCEYEVYVQSHGMIIHTGALTTRLPLDTVKMLRDHDHSDPVGYMLTWDEKTLAATFKIAEGENGDRALLEASPEQKLRDGLSIGFSILEYEFDADWTLHVHLAEIHEVSLCAIPAVNTARVTNVAASLRATTPQKEETIMNRAQLAAALAAGTITQAEHDAQLATIIAAETARPAPVAPQTPVVPSEFAAGPAAPVAAPPARLEVRDRPNSLRAITSRVAAAIATHDPRQVALALEDVLIADDAGNAWIGREDWIGEVWRATRSGRPWIESFGTPRPLTSTKIKGWAWVNRPKPAKYTGGKTDVPSNAVSTEPVEATPERWAGGWDIDRIFWDLGDEQFLTDFWIAAMLEYQLDSDFDVAQTIVAAATEAVAPQTTVLGAISGSARRLRTIGAAIDNIWLAEDLFEEYADLKIVDLPAWLANQLGGVSLREGTAVVGDLNIAADPGLDDGTLVAYDKRAATVYEGPEIRVEALNIPKGGVDLGYFNYGGVIVNDARAIVSETVEAP